MDTPLTPPPSTPTGRVVAVLPASAPNVFFVYCEGGEVYLHDPLDGRSDRLPAFPGRITEAEGGRVVDDVRPTKQFKRA